MRIEKLEITNFRSISDIKLDLKKLNLFIGPNAAGKTSILESLYYLAYTKSYKGNVKNVLKENEDFLKVVATTSKGKYKIIDTITSSKISLNNVDYKKRLKYVGELLIVLFNPSDLELVKSEPSKRRKWLNMTIGPIDYKHLEDLSYYNHLLKERNKILKTDQDEILLDIITEKLSYYNNQITNKRKKFIMDLNYLLKNYSKRISNEKDVVEIEYSYTDDLYSKLKDKISYDLLTKTTNYGSHRDNLIFKLNGKDAKDHASQGQIRTILLAITLSVIDLYKKEKGENAILLLDDVFNELDESRINSLFSSIDDEIQVLMTSTDLKNIEKFNLQNVKIFNILNGEIMEEENGK